MGEPEGMGRSKEGGDSGGRSAQRRPSRRLRIALLCAIPALLLAGAAGAFWTGYRLYDQPFLWFNQNRIAATADRAARWPEAATVVALGGTPLRHATLDEAAMSGLAARHGIAGLHFLRIVHDQAEFADFEPMLDAILRLAPDVLLLDLDLLFTERRTLVEVRRYAATLAGTLRNGTAYRSDQIALQYGKACRPAAAGPAASDAKEAESFDRQAVAWRDRVRFTPDPPAFERVRRFADRARAAGARVVLLHLHRPPALEERLHGPGGYPPAALARLDGARGLPVWRFPDGLRRAAHHCADGTLGAEGRRAYSEWLASGIAELLRRPPVEEAALPPGRP